MSAVGSPERPLRVAVIGSGPAGFYAAGQLLGQDEFTAAVDLYDRLATPWGLVRFGVAPDHPKIKSVTRIFERTALKPGFRFLGNVEIGSDLSHQQLVDAYDAVIYAVGTPSDRKLGIPGEDLPGSVPATEFVAWYNGHPDYAELDFDLSGERAVVIGNGNVALDVARMLALSPDELKVTDTADHAIAALARSEIREIVVLGRRGPAQAAFTNPELRELGELELADVIVDPTEAALDAASAASLESADGTVKRNVETLTEYASRTPGGKPRRVVLRFLMSPVELEGTHRVDAVVAVRNELVATPDGGLRAQPTDELERIPAGLVLRSVGYVGTPLPGVPFDHEGLRILNDGGRVLDPDSRAPLPGVYTAGWIKRGPSGVIGTNKKCATETVERLLEDVRAGALASPRMSPDELIESLRGAGTQIVEYSGWEAIDAHERSLGERHGRPRVKLVRRMELLAIAAGERIRDAV
ncbi:MAG TPA: FAD-dependent oxidoreductase [Solirubrobacteraceae bacterium]|nr:FAD-dependent oxidoreductase [Solirubrobacteraceae bacterium]